MHNKGVLFFAKAEAAFVKHLTDAPVVAVSVGERGFYPIYTSAKPADLNDPSVTEEEVTSAIAGSMFGWRTPIARLALDRAEAIISAKEAA